LNGCVSSRPQSFVDADALPCDFAGREHRAFVRGERLVIEVSQISGFNVVGFDAFEQAGALYVSHDASVPEAAEWRSSRWMLPSISWAQMASARLLAVAVACLSIGHPGFWSSEQRSPWPRKKMEILTR